MERPKPEQIIPTDRYDHELALAQVNIITFTDLLLMRKPENSYVARVDIPLATEPSSLLSELEKTTAGSFLIDVNTPLLARPVTDEGINIKVHKKDLMISNIFIRAEGWEYEKVRPTDIDEPVRHFPRPTKSYQDERDKSRRLELIMKYTREDGLELHESVSVFAATSHQDYHHMFSDISVPEHTLVSPHGISGQIYHEISDEAIDEFLDLLARHIKD